MALAYYLFPKEVNTVIQGASLAPEDKEKEQKKELFDETANYEHLDDPLMARDMGSAKPIRNEEPSMVYSQPYPRPEVQKQEEAPQINVQVMDATPAVKAFFGISTTIILLVIFWLLFSVAAIIYSLVCVGRSGSVFEKIVGIALALFLGPFYFIYLVANKGYCS